ncbi:MAG: hypothetical protein HY294_11640 [Candidatus Rokubacteria bacterium]|nr:hypothetical protein [Candidatus Rokubacteria bacterium]MBI3826641.1 hypothetical protein [Candidatus Rokubacteria bacterium]
MTSPAPDEAADERPLEGWCPHPSEVPLPEIVDQAFDYRGDVTVLRRGADPIVGYVYNRETGGPAPFLQMFQASDGAALTVPYAEIHTIHFTGRDPAAGKSYEAWLRRKAAGAGV